MKGDKVDKGDDGYVSQEVINSIIFTVKNELLERDHPPGSCYFTFFVNDNPNNRFPNTTWVKIEEKTYLVSVGPNLLGMTPVGSNTDILTSNEALPHIHNFRTNTNGGILEKLPRIISAVRTESLNTSVTKNRTFTSGANAAETEISIENTGGGEAHNNMPKSLAIYTWRRTA